MRLCCQRACAQGADPFLVWCRRANLQHAVHGEAAQQVEPEARKGRCEGEEEDQTGADSVTCTDVSPPHTCPLPNAGSAQAIEKGNKEGAQIYAENTIRKKNEALQMLQCVPLPAAPCYLRLATVEPGGNTSCGYAGSRRELMALLRSSNRSKRSEGCGSAHRILPLSLPLPHKQLRSCAFDHFSSACVVQVARSMGAISQQLGVAMQSMDTMAVRHVDSPRG